MGYKEKFEEKLFDFCRWTHKVSGMKKRINDFKKKPFSNALTKEQEKEVLAFYKPYKKPSLVFHRYFTGVSGAFYPNYIPQDLYVGYIDPYFNDILAAKFYDNKTNYDALFHGIPQPKTVLKRVNGIWMDGDNHPVFDGDALKGTCHLSVEGGCFVKEAQTTAGGSGVTYIPQDQFSVQKVLEIAGKYKTDVIVQEELIQHEGIARLHASSLNTLRMYSVLGKDGNATIYSAVVRMGAGNAKLDNYSAGGLTCGIQPNGRLRKYGYNKKYEKMECHPTSKVVFSDYEIPNYQGAVELIKKAHPMIPHFRSIAWDIAIRHDGVPVLIEANLCRGGIDSLQLNNGPLYGDDTKKILDEVFQRK
jgi:hypothetical protein